MTPPPLLLAAVAGLLYYLGGFTTVSWWPLTFAGAVMLFGLLDSSSSLRQASLRAVVMKFTALMPALPYLSGLGFSVHLAAVCIHAASWWVLAFVYWHARSRAGRLAGLLILPGLWTLAEWLGTVKHFLPSHVTTWSNALAEPAIAIAPFTGAFGVSTVAAALAVLPWVAWRAAAVKGAERRRAWALIAVAYAGLFGPPLAGRVLYGPVAPPSSGPPLRAVVLTLETNDAMEQYLQQGQYTAEGARAIVAHVRGRTARLRELLRGLEADLIVLPEEAMRFSLVSSRSKEAFERFGIENNGVVIDALRDLAREVRTDLATGMITIRGGRRYNTSMLIGKDGTLLGLRDKWMLTPGSEYWPGPAWLPAWMLFVGDAHYVHPSRQYSWPDEAFPPLAWNGWTLGTSICLEGHMPMMYLGWRRAGAELLLFLGNAHWFNWDPGTFNFQLLRIVRLSSAAYGLPVLMTGKANYSGVIGPDGMHQVWPRLLEGEREAAHEVLVPRASATPTLAVRWGEYYLPLSAFLVLLVLAASTLLAKTPIKQPKTTPSP